MLKLQFAGIFVLMYVHTALVPERAYELAAGKASSDHRSEISGAGEHADRHQSEAYFQPNTHHSFEVNTTV
jgi:hypothetical protein